MPRSDRLRFDLAARFSRDLYSSSCFSFYFIFSDIFLYTWLFICSGSFWFYFNSALKAEDCGAGLSIKRRRLQSQGFSEADDKLIARVERVNVREKKEYIFNEITALRIFMLSRV